MKRVFLKSTFAALLSVFASLGLVIVAVPAIGAVNGWLLALCIACPALAAWPASAYTFWQGDRLHRAHMELEKAHKELAETHRKLTEKSKRDPMTGFLNRESFFSEFETHRRRSDHGAMLIIDADHFKQINDRFGHLVGDEALLAISGAIIRGLRSADIIGRIGGEEFAAFLFGASRDEALRIAERVRMEVEKLVFMPDKATTHRLTVSIGGTVFVANGTISDHMRAADRRLYEAKQSGRNRTILDPEIRVAA